MNNSTQQQHFPLQKLVLGEVNALILGMRNVHSMRFSNRYRFQYENITRQQGAVGNESSILIGMRNLRERISSNLTWQTLSTMDILQPFFAIIKSEDTEGRLTSMALRSLQKFLEFPGFIETGVSQSTPNNNTEDSKTIIEEIVTSVQQCQFEFNATDAGSLSESGGPIILDHSLGSGLGSIASISSETSLLESVLIQIINTFLCCIKSEAGKLLDESTILEILKSVLRIGRETRPSTDSLRKTAELAIHEMVTIVFLRRLNECPNESSTMGEIIFEFICEMCDIYSTSSVVSDNTSQPSMKLGSSTNSISTTVNSIGTRYLGINLACHVIELLGDRLTLSSYKNILSMICNHLCRALLRNVNISYQTILFLSNGEMMFSGSTQSGLGSSSTITSSILGAANGGNLQPTHSNYGNNLMLLSAALKCSITYLFSLSNIRSFLHEQIAAILLSLLQHLPPSQQQYGSSSKKSQFSNSPILGNSSIFLPFELQELILEYLVEVCRDSNLIAFLYRHYDCYGCFDKNQANINVNTVPNLFEHIYLYLNSYIGLNSSVTGNMTGSPSTQTSTVGNTIQLGQGGSTNLNNFGSSVSLSSSSQGNPNLHTLHVLAWQGLLSVVRCLAERCQEQQEQNIRQSLDMHVVNNMTSEIKLHKKQKHRMMEIVSLFNSSPLEGVTQLLQIYNIVIPKDLTSFIRNENSVDENSVTVDWNEAVSLLQCAAEKISNFLLEYNVWLDKQKIVDYFNSFSSPANTIVDIKIKECASTENNSTLTENNYLIPILSKSKKDPLRNVLPLEVMRQFMDGFDFYGMRIDEAMRYFINRCKISGEGQQVERIVKLLGECYYRDNNTNFAKERNMSCSGRTVPAVPYLANGEQAWILAVAIMMLHTDLHHHHNRNNRMNLEGFIRTVGYHEELQEMPKDELQKIFHYVLTNEFEVVTGLIDSYKSETVWNELIVRRSMEYYESNFIQKPSSFSNEKDNLLPYIYDMEMFQSMWGHVILATTIILENSDDIHLLELAIRGFLDSARVAATYHLHHVFDNLVITLCKFTTLLDGITPPSISVVNCTNSNSNQPSLENTTGLTWPTNASVSTTIVSHDGVVISTINGGVDGIVTSPASPSSTNQIINSSSSFNSNIGKVNSTSRTDKNRSIVMFGHNEKAKLACRTVFAITRKYGDNLREGWKNILDLICRMRELELLPESLIESRLVRQLREFQFSTPNESKLSSPRKESGDQSLSNQASSQLLTSGSSLYGHIISSISKSATKKLKPKSQNQAQTQVKSATFSLLSSVFGGFYGSSSDETNEKKKNTLDSDDSDDDHESQALGGQDTEFEHFSIEIKHALDEARKCIEQCRIVELLMMDAKELSGHSLEYLLSALIRNGKPSGVVMSIHIPAPHLFALKTSTSPQQKQSSTSHSNVTTYYYYERDIETSLFCLDLLCDVLISNNLNRNTITDRLKLIWNYAYGHVYKLMISILQMYEPINVIQSIYQVPSSPQSAPSALVSSKIGSNTSVASTERASPISTSAQTNLRTRMTKQHYHILQRCITCIWRLCMELSTPSTSLSQVSEKSASEQQEWTFIQKEMLSVLIDHLGKQWNEGLLGVFHMSLLPMIHMFLSRHSETLLSPMGKKFIYERTNMTNNTNVVNTLTLSSSSQVIVEFWDHLVFKILKSISTASISWINNNPSSTLFTSLKPSQQLQLLSRSLDILTLSLQQSNINSQESSFNIWFVVPDNIPTFVQTFISILSASITTNVNIQSSNSNHAQFVGTLKKLMTLAQDILSTLENLVSEILKRIVSTAFSSVSGSQNVIRLDNKWINAWLSILEGISILCCTGGINSSSSSGNSLNLLMSQLSSNQIQMLSQLQRDIRTQALSTLQRSLIVSCDFKYASSLNQQQLIGGSENENLKYLLNDQLLMLCMEKVLVKSFLQTLLGLKPKTTEYQSNHNTEMDISSLEELRVRANNLLARIFLHFLPRMFKISENQQENGFQSLWLMILQVMYSFLLVKPKSDHLREALPELLKNMILVMNNIEVFKFNPQLWTVTENELSQTMPSLVEDVKPRIIASMNKDQSNNGNLSNESTVTVVDSHVPPSSSVVPGESSQLSEEETPKDSRAESRH